MSRGILRKPSIKKSLAAKYKGAYTRKLKKSLIPGYGTKTAGWLHPKRKLYNKIYYRTSIDTRKVIADALTKKNERNTSSTSSNVSQGKTSSGEKWILWGTTIICAIIGLSIDGFLGFILLAVVAYFATKFAIKKHDERFPASLTPQEREAMKKEKEEKACIKAEKKAQADAEAQAVIQRLQKAKQDRMQAKMKCPRCGSKNIQLAGKHRKGFSVGKAVGGAALTGGIGALAGFAGKQTKKSDWVCLDCGRSFTIK